MLFKLLLYPFDLIGRVFVKLMWLQLKINIAVQRISHYFKMLLFYTALCITQLLLSVQRFEFVACFRNTVLVSFCSLLFILSLVVSSFKGSLSTVHLLLDGVPFCLDVFVLNVHRLVIGVPSHAPLLRV